MMKRFYFALATMLLLGVLGVCGAAVYTALQSSPPVNLSLASFAPQGALLSIESPDFKALL